MTKNARKESLEENNDLPIPIPKAVLSNSIGSFYWRCSKASAHSYGTENKHMKIILPEKNPKKLYRESLKKNCFKIWVKN